MTPGPGWPTLLGTIPGMSSTGDPRTGIRRLVMTIAAAVVALDAVSKAIAAQALAGRGVVNVLGGLFHLELYRNFAGPATSSAGPRRSSRS